MVIIMRASRIMFFISFIFLVMVNLSFTWPLEESRLTSTFGESRGDHFHDGIDLISTNSDVKPLASGKTMFMWDQAMFPLDNEPGGGNYLILKHPEKGLYSVYMHLEKGLSHKSEIGTADVLGRVGNTGHSFAAHLHFGLFTDSGKKSINPLTVLSSYKDKEAPEISEFALLIGDRYVIVRENSTIRLTQHYPLLIRVVDSVSGRERLGVYRLKVAVNGVPAVNREFDAIENIKGNHCVGGKPFQEVFDIKGYYRVPEIKYRSGLNTIVVEAEDLAGNRSVKEFSCTVNLDLDQG